MINYINDKLLDVFKDYYEKSKYIEKNINTNLNKIIISMHFLCKVYKTDIILKYILQSFYTILQKYCLNKLK